MNATNRPEKKFENNCRQLLRIWYWYCMQATKETTAEGSRGRLWIQEYNSKGDNWVDYVGFDENKTLAQACDDMLETSATFKGRKFRVIRRNDEVVDVREHSTIKSIKRGTWRDMRNAGYNFAGCTRGSGRLPKQIKVDKQGVRWAFKCYNGPFCCIIQKVEDK